MIRLLSTLVAAILLAGCWTGERLYAENDAQVVIDSGSYAVVAADEPNRIARVTVLPSGMTGLEIDGEMMEIGFVPIDAARNTFVAWAMDNRAGPGEANQLFLLGVRQPNGEFTLYAPPCDGEFAELARVAGATMRAGMVAECRFPDRASLEGAMRRLEPVPDQLVMKLAPLPQPK